MSDAWSWHYNPDAQHVTGDLPGGVVAEVERLAEQLAVLGRDACEVGRGRWRAEDCARWTSSEGAAS
ncbi:hypothetical protein ACIRSJ_18350 [Streptomyces virginiae]|uniref:hypothetical protein n=1 Tax=Streptomyces virginiae TaxID=1961 RepID=UPI0038244E13